MTQKTAARKVSAAIDPEALDRVLWGMRLRDAMDSIPDEMLDALDEALTAHVRSRRDPAAVRAVLVERIPAIVRGLNAYVRESMNSFILWDTDTIRKGKSATATPIDREDAKDAEEGLSRARAVRRWLFPSGRGKRTKPAA